MENDRKTVPSYINVVLDDDSKYLDKLRKRSVEDAQNDGENNKLSLREEDHILSGDEIYYEEGVLHIATNLSSKEGTSYICIEVPLSQEVLFDILGESIKKLNKIKTIFEATK